MADDTCSVEGCSKTGQLKRGWCGGHYRRWQRHGDVGSAELVRTQAICTVVGCDRPNASGGLCKAHLHRLQRDGDVQADKPVQNYRPRGTGGVCLVPNCMVPTAKRYCAAHATRLAKFGDVQAEIPVKRRNGEREPQPCTVDGCDRVGKTRGLCTGHYTRLNRTGDVGKAELRALPNRLPPGTPCSVPDCSRPVKTRGWCKAHYSRWQKVGNIRADMPIELRGTERSAPTCCVAECSRDVYGQGFCGMHYQRWFKSGDPGRAEPNRLAGRSCTHNGCGEPYFSLDFCLLHYSRFKNHGHPDGGQYHHREIIRKTKHLPPEDRFWARVNKNGLVPTWRPDLGPCWIWLGQISTAGYGESSTARLLSGSASTHRTAWLLSGEPLIEGMELDHLCRVTACCNPRHLEQVTPLVNNMRGNSASAKNARKTRCKQGHKFTPENTIVRYTKVGRTRICRTCWNTRVRSRRAAKRLTRDDRRISTAYREAIADDPCFYCGAHAETVDHFFPLIKGGTDHYGNLRKACASCNSLKNARCGTVFALQEGGPLFARVFPALAAA